MRVCERGRLVELYINQIGRIALVLDKGDFFLIAFGFKTSKFSLMMRSNRNKGSAQKTKRKRPEF